MAVTIIANGHLGTLKKQRVSTNTTSVQLSKILNDANIIPPVTNEPGKVFSFWGTTINGFDVGGYTINQLYSIGAITKDGILNIYANYSYVANNVQITFNANGGKFADGTTTKAISVPLGSIYAELESSIDLPTLSGKAFKAWTGPSNTVINGYSEFSGAIILSAQWENATNVNIAVKDSRGKSVIAGSYPRSTLWKDLYAQAISNGYTPDDVKKVFSKIKPGYGSYTGQAIKSIDFSVANNPMKIGWLRGSIYETANADVSLYTNRNLYLNSKALADGYGANGNVKITVEPFDSTTNMWHLVAAQGIGGNVGMYIIFSGSGIQFNGLDWSYSADIKGTGKASYFGKEYGDKSPVKGNIGSEWSRISQTGHADDDNIRIIVMYFDTADSPLDVYIKLPKLEKGTTPTPWTPAPEDINKKIRDFAATTIPVDPSTTFAVTGKATNNIVLTHNPIGQNEYWTNRNLLLGTEQFVGDWGRWQYSYSWDADPYNGHKAVQTASAWGGPKYAINDLFRRKVVSPNTDYTLSVKIKNTSNQAIDMYFYAPAMGIRDRHIIKLPPNSDWTTISTTFKFSDINPNIDQGSMRFEPSSGIPSGQGTIIQTEMKFERGSVPTPYTPAPEDTKPGLWLNNDWLYNPYTQKWLDTPIDNPDYSYSNSVITFKNYFNVQYVTGDISKVRDSVTATVKSVVSGYGSTTDKKPLYNNSYFPSDDSGVTLNVEEYLGYSYIIFYNQASRYYQKIYQQAGTKYSEFLKLISKPKFDINGKFMKGFYISNYWANSKLIAGMPINAPIEYAFSGYLDPNTSTFVRVTFDANGGSFYKDTSYETTAITLEVSPLDTYGIIINYLPDISKRTLGLLFWVMDLVNMEPAYPLTVKNGQTIYPKWTVKDKVELYRKPREYYLIDLNSIYNGWDMMDKFSLSDKNNIFVIDPTGTGVSYSEDNTKSNSNGWSKYNRNTSSNAIEFDAYYNGYDQYNRLGRWARGKELVLAMLNETGIPTYWTVDIAEIERTEIKHGTDLLNGKISFNKTSPAFDLEFIGLGTDNTIDNSDDMFRRNAYVYIHSLRVPDKDKGIQIIVTDGKTTIEDAVDIDLPAGSYFEYSTLPFRELWKYGPSWQELTHNLYNNIINLVGARPIKVGIGKWDISVSSSTKVSISSLAPHKIQDYAGKTIDSLGGLGPFTGIVIKEKEL